MNVLSTSRILSLPILALTLVFQSQAYAQEKEQSHGIFDSREDYYEFMGTVKQAAATNPELMAMIPMINDVVLLQPFGSTSKQHETSDGTLGLLANESIRKELEVVDSQYEELQRTNEQIQKQFAEQLRDLDLSDMKSATRQILAMRNQTQKELQSTLLPHQMKRLRQLAARNQLRSRSLIDVITSEPLKTVLELSDEQAKQLRLEQRQAEKELQRQISELRAKAQQRLVAKLKSHQRKQVEEIFGDVIGRLDTDKQAETPRK